MHHREALGVVDVSDDELTRLVAALLGEDATDVALLESHAGEVPYELPAMTTGGRWWVRGIATLAGERTPWSFFVKQVQSWGRSPLFADVPAEIRPMAEARVPWRTEPLVYRSDLHERLPAGLTMPRALGVFDLDEKSSSVWLEEVPCVPGEWDLARFSRAAYLLGRLAASPRVRERADVGEFDWTVRDYLDGRLTHQVLPLLKDDDVWQHPVVASAFDSALRTRLRDLADRAADLVDELVALPVATIHGDACPNNLLVTGEGDGFVLIDYGFFGLGPVGFDLGQLLVGEVQVGRMPSSRLTAVEEAVVPSYVDGLREEGCDVGPDVVRRAHAVHLALFTGLSTLPFEHLGDEPTPWLHEVAAERAAIATFSLDLLDGTEP